MIFPMATDETDETTEATFEIIGTDRLNADHIRKYGALLPKVGNVTTYVVGIIAGVHHEVAERGYETVVTLQVTKTEAVSVSATDSDIAVGTELGPLIARAAELFR